MNRDNRSHSSNMERPGGQVEDEKLILENGSSTNQNVLPREPLSETEMATNEDRLETIDGIEPGSDDCERDSSDKSNENSGDRVNVDNSKSRGEGDHSSFEPGVEKNYHRGIGPPVRKPKPKDPRTNRGRKTFTDNKISQISSVYSSKGTGHGNRKRPAAPYDKTRHNMPRKREHKSYATEETASGTEDAPLVENLPKFSSADNVNNIESQENLNQSSSVNNIRDENYQDQPHSSDKKLHAIKSHNPVEKIKPAQQLPSLESDGSESEADSERDSIEFLNEKNGMKIHYGSGKQKPERSLQHTGNTRSDNHEEKIGDGDSTDSYIRDISVTSLSTLNELADSEFKKRRKGSAKGPDKRPEDATLSSDVTEKETTPGGNETTNTGSLNGDEAKSSPNHAAEDNISGTSSKHKDVDSVSQSELKDSSLSVVEDVEQTPLNTSRTDGSVLSEKSSPKQTAAGSQENSNRPSQESSRSDVDSIRQRDNIITGECNEQHDKENMTSVDTENEEGRAEAKRVEKSEETKDSPSTQDDEHTKKDQEAIAAFLTAFSEGNDQPKKEDSNNNIEGGNSNRSDNAEGDIDKANTTAKESSKTDVGEVEPLSTTVQDSKPKREGSVDNENKSNSTDRPLSKGNRNSETNSSNDLASSKTTLSSHNTTALKTVGKKGSDDSLASQTSNFSGVVKERKQNELRRFNKRPESDKSKKSSLETPRHVKTDKTNNIQMTQKPPRKVSAFIDKNKNAKTIEKKTGNKQDQKTQKEKPAKLEKVSNTNNSNKKMNGFLPSAKREKTEKTKPSEPEKQTTETKKNKIPDEEIKVERTETKIEITEIEDETEDANNNDGGGAKSKPRISKGILDKLRKGGGLVQPTNHDTKPLLNGSIKKGMALTVPTDTKDDIDSDKSSPRPSIDMGSRKSVDYRSQNINTVVNVDNTEEKPKSVVTNKNDEWIRSAIPYLPLGMSIFCLISNIFLPGLGTIVSGFCVLCCGKSRLGSKDENVIQTLCVNVWVGAAQLFTVTFLLVGWFWSIAWGVKMVLLSLEYRKEQKEKRQRELQSLALSAFGNNLNMRRLLPV